MRLPFPTDNQATPTSPAKSQAQQEAEALRGILERLITDENTSETTKDFARKALAELDARTVAAPSAPVAQKPVGDKGSQGTGGCGRDSFKPKPEPIVDLQGDSQALPVASVEVGPPAPGMSVQTQPLATIPALSRPNLEADSPASAAKLNTLLPRLIRG